MINFDSKIEIRVTSEQKQRYRDLAASRDQELSDLVRGALNRMVRDAAELRKSIGQVE